MENLNVSVIEQYIKIVEQHSIVSMTDSSGNIVYINNLFEEISGYSKQELIGKNHNMLKSDKNDRHLFRKVWETITKGNVWHGIICNKRKDGSLYWVKSTIAPIFDNKNKIKNYISIRTDITNEKLIIEETKLFNVEQENIFNIISCGISILKNRIITKCNYEFEKMLGYDQGELIGKDTRKIYLNDGQYFGVGVLAYGKKEDNKFEVKLRKKDGSFIWVSGGCIGINPEDPIRHAIYAIVDISKQKQQEIELVMHRDHLQDMIEERVEELLEDKIKAEKANLAKNDFLAKVSHELRTPIHGINSFSNFGIKLIKENNLDEVKLLNYFEKIHLSGDRLLKLINDILDIEKIDSGNMIINKEISNIKEIIINSVQEQEALILNKNIEIIYDMDDNCLLPLDKSLMYQLASNLLFNAIKFSPQSGKVSILLKKEYSEIKLQVIDSGFGIPEEEIDTIFEKYVQGKSTSKKLGTGLGLTICSNIVKLHNGKIIAKNKDNKKGAIFEVTFPIQE